MRIISGSLKGRRFHPPADHWPTRPTTDYAKEGLFNILTNRLDFESIQVLDLFGGTGNHSFEFISRGCQDVTYVDKFPPCVQFVEKMAREWKISDRLHIHRSDVFRFIEWTVQSFDYIFAGPPYALPQIDTLPDRIFARSLLKAEGLFVIEHNPHVDFQRHPHCREVRHYGKTHFSFFE